MGGAVKSISVYANIVIRKIGSLTLGC